MKNHYLTNKKTCQADRFILLYQNNINTNNTLSKADIPTYNEKTEKKW